MQETVKIRRMKKEDLDRVVEISSDAYGNHHWPKDSFNEELNNNLSRYYVLINNENIICGYIGCWHVFEEAHVTNFAVHSQYKRRGYGEALIKTAIEGCMKEKVKYLTLEVRKSNTPAKNIYAKYGFVSFGERKKYYQDNNEDAIVMWTKNIFFDEFKGHFEKAIAKLNERLCITYE